MRPDTRMLVVFLIALVLCVACRSSEPAAPSPAVAKQRAVDAIVEEAQIAQAGWRQCIEDLREDTRAIQACNAALARCAVRP